jgi:hypothetical protein
MFAVPHFLKEGAKELSKGLSFASKRQHEICGFWAGKTRRFL